MNARLEQLNQLKSITHDGDLIDKQVRDELVKDELAQRGHGWNWLTAKGVETLKNVGLMSTNRPAPKANIIAALDALALALAEHGHHWTPEQRAHYENAVS